MSLEETFELDREIELYFIKNIIECDIKSKKLSNANTYSRFIKNFDNIDKRKKLNELIIMYKLSDIYSRLSEYILYYFTSVFYIAPVRATAERYYRLRNTSVDEVDCSGKNLPIFINSLSENDYKNFQRWTEKNLGFIIEKSLSEGHVSLKIRKTESQKAVNLSDSGFGYSQILPIITQLWYITHKKIDGFFRYKRIIPITILIEQPELHLHPALQAKLVDVMVKVIKSSYNSRYINFIIETHSETIINRLGNLIYWEKIEKDDVAIFMFNREIEKQNTNIELSNFDDNGYLNDWPIGFFEPKGDFDFDF